MVYAVSGSFWVTAAQVCATLFSIPLSIAFAHFLTQNEYGLYKYALSIASLVSIFSLTGLATGITRAAANGYDNSLFQGIKLSLISSAGVVAASLVGAIYYAINENIPLATALLIVGALSPFFNSSSFFGAFLNGKRDFKQASTYNTFRNLLCSLLILATIVLTADPLWILSVYFLSYAGTGILISLHIHRKTKRNDLADPELTRFSLHTSVINGLAIAADKIDSILLFQHLGAAQLAIYAFAELIPDALNRFGKIFNVIALPKYVHNKAASGILHKTLLISVAFIPVVIAYFFAAPYIFQFFFPAYMEAVPFTQALAFLLLFNGTLPVAYLDAQAAIRNKYILSVASNIIKIVLVVIGVIGYGLWGAVIARLLSKIIGVSLGVVIARITAHQLTTSAV